MVQNAFSMVKKHEWVLNTQMHDLPLLSLNFLLHAQVFFPMILSLLPNKCKFPFVHK